MARRGVTSAELARNVEALFQGAQAGQVFEGGLTSTVAVRLPEGLRADPEQLALLPVTNATGDVMPLSELARVRFDLGPGLVRREDVQRVAMLTANVSGTDLTGVVDKARDEVARRVKLPAGYQVVFGGQFEEAERSQRNLALLAVVVLAAIYGVLYLAFKSHRQTTIVLVNLPLAMIGGVLALTVSGGIISVASLVGFFALFGVATRDGVLLVSHYQHLMSEEGASLAEAVRRGSEERLAPVLMTALTAGLALIPLVIAGDRPGNEIQSPMGQVILGGLLTSTFLNLVVVPVLFERWGGDTGRERS
jgi:Cu/Ag efflux pump CusA